MAEWIIEKKLRLLLWLVAFLWVIERPRMWPLGLVITLVTYNINATTSNISLLAKMNCGFYAVYSWMCNDLDCSRGGLTESRGVVANRILVARLCGHVLGKSQSLLPCICAIKSSQPCPPVTEAWPTARPWGLYWEKTLKDIFWVSCARQKSVKTGKGKK